MKKLLKILIFIIFLLIVFVIVTPIVFKGKIVKTLKTDINKNIDAQVDFTDLNISLLSYFPNLKVSIKDISITGNREFNKIQLLSLKQISAKINILSLLKKKIDVLSIRIDNPKLNLITLKNGHSNWDIAKNSKTSTKQQNNNFENPPEINIKLNLQKFKIINCAINFENKLQGIKADMQNLNYSLTGSLNKKNLILDMILNIGKLSVKQTGITFLNKAHISYESRIQGNLKTLKFTLMKNTLSINKIKLSLIGYLQKIDNRTIYTDLKLATNKNDFKDLLSMVPAVFTKDFKDISASGTVEINGFVKGKISSEVHPSFGINLLVQNAGFKYPDLPKNASDININLKINNPDGIDDHTVIDLQRFAIKLGDNPFSAHYVVKTPVSDPSIEGSVKGKINFDTLNDVIPVQDVKLTGFLNTDIYLKGKLSYIQKKQYDKFIAKGSFKLGNFLLKTKDFKDIFIKNATVFVNPRFFVLKEFKGKVGNSDFNLKGNIANFLGFYLKKQTLRANFSFISNNLDLNQLIPQNKTDNQSTQTTQIDIPPIPENLDLALNLNLSKIRFDKLLIKDLKGKIALKKAVASLDNVRMNIVGGNLKLNGNFVSGQPNRADLKIDLSNLDLQKAFITFNTIKKLTPVAKNCKGKISLHLYLKTDLDSKLQPIYETMNGNGTLKSDNIEYADSHTLNKIASLLKNDKFKKLKLKNINMKFKLKNGDIIISPVKFKMANSMAIFSGKQSVDLKMNYNLIVEIPYKDLTKSSAFLAKLKSKGDKWLKYINPSEKIRVNIKIRGTVKEPKISLDTGDYISRLKAKIVADLKKKAEKEAKKQAAKILAETNKQIEKILNLANKKANDIRKAGKKAAQKLISETDKKVEQMIKKANGEFAKTLAREAGKKLKIEARKKANQIESEANNKADQIINEAKKQAKKLKEKAKQKTDELIKKAVDAVDI